MTSSAKRLAVAVLLLLLPTMSVGWLGLREIGRLEEAVADSMSAGTNTVLRGAEQEYTTLLGQVVREQVLRLASRKRAAIERELRTLPERANDPENPAPVLCGFLLDSGGQPVFPRPAPRMRSIEPSLPPNQNRGQAPAAEIVRRLRQAEFFAMLGQPREALGTIENAPNPDDDPTIAARLAWEKARLLAKLDDPDGAIESFRRAARLIEESRLRARAGSQALMLLAVVGEVETLERVHRTNGKTDSDDTWREGQIARIASILSRISSGAFDAENDVWLDTMFDRVAALAAPYAEADLDLELRLDELRQRNRERAALRAVVAEVIDRNVELGSPKTDMLKSYALHGPTTTTLLAFHPIAVATTPAKRLWLGLQIDLPTLFANLTRQLEKRLSDTGVQYRIELVDAAGRPIVGALEAPLEDEQAALSATRQTLGPPLLGFSLVALPTDPAKLVRDTRRSLLIKALLLIALAFVAGLGAFALVRIVRREAELARMKTEFVGRVSHELKTPLALIRMYGETLALGRVSDPAKVSEFSSIVAKEADRLTGMIDNVLDFSRIEAGTKVYTPVATRIDLHLNSLLESYAPHLEDEGCSLDWDAFPRLWIDIDPDGLTQAVVNLLANARKYSAATKEVRVLARRDGRDLVIEVLDRGIGVPAGEADRVFDTFYRASTAGERRGSGLGLALVRHFARGHGGDASCEPREGGGTVFRIRLPLADETDGPGERGT